MIDTALHPQLPHSDSRVLRRHVFALAGLLLIVPTVRAAQSSRDVWVRAKCALCHGLDGSSRTDTGRKVQAPDLRAPGTQKLTDQELARIISAGHKRMPSFRTQTNVEKVRLLVSYIRGLLRVPVPPSPPPRSR
jgi:hypothetical protein